MITKTCIKDIFITLLEILAGVDVGLGELTRVTFLRVLRIYNKPFISKITGDDVQIGIRASYILRY